jgi:ribonuclease BN (tRNA processing enzyme)
MGLSITVLGCSGTYAAPGGACSGYVVRAGDTSVWVDCGPGTLANLQEHVRLEDLTAIVVSHSHPDHWTELPVVRNAMRFGVERAGVPVFATAETVQQATAALGEAFEPTLVWTMLDGSPIEIGPIRFSFSRTDHPVETYAIRAEANGGSIVYSADTGPAWEPGDFAAADVFVCEATLTPDFEGGPPHLSRRQAGELARQVGARRLVITHHWPGADLDAAYDEASTAYGGPIDVAAVHERYDTA